MSPRATRWASAGLAILIALSLAAVLLHGLDALFIAR